MTHIDAIQVASSRLLNAVINGDHGEMLSTRAYKTRHTAPFMYEFLNAFFFWEKDHCKESYDWEMSLK